MAEEERKKPVVTVRPFETAAGPLVAVTNVTTTLRFVQARTVRVVVLGASAFHEDGVVPLPGAAPSALDALASVLRYARSRPLEHLLVAGQDPDEGAGAARAAATHALLSGDRAAWVAACERGSVRDWQALLLLASQVRGWPCDPGGVDGAAGPKTRGALAAFRARAGLGGSGDFGPDDWGVLFDVVQERIGRRVKDLAQVQAALARTTPPVVGCAASWALERVRLRGYPGDTERRVDLLLFTEEDVPHLRCHPPDGACQPNLCDVFRKAKYVAEPLPPEPRPRAGLLDVADTHFHLESAVFLPRLGADDAADLAEPAPFDPADPVWGELGGGASDGPDLALAFRDLHQPIAPSAIEVGLRVLVLALRFHRRYPDRRLLVAGHTDRSGSDAYNRPLSDARAACIAALLVGDRDAFVAACTAYSKPEDDVVVLDYVARTRGWPCQPKPGAKQAGWAEVRAFQERYDADFGQSIPTDGAIGKKTRAAYFDIYQDDLATVLGGADALAQDRASLAWVDPARPALGCGESFPRVHPEVDGLREEQNRRVEVLFFEPDEVPPAATGEAVYGGDYDFDPIGGGAAAGAPPGDGAFRHTTEASSTPGVFGAPIADDPAPPATTAEEGWLYSVPASLHRLPGWNELPPLEAAPAAASSLPFRFGVQVPPGSPWAAPGATFSIVDPEGWRTRTYDVVDGEPVDDFRVFEFTEAEPGTLYDGVLRAGEDELVVFTGCDIARFVNPGDDYDELPPDEGIVFQDSPVDPLPDPGFDDFDPGTPSSAEGEVVDDGSAQVSPGANPFLVDALAPASAPPPGEPPPGCTDPIEALA